MCYFWTEFRSNVCNSKSNAAVPAEPKYAALVLPIQTLLNTLHQKMLRSQQCEHIYSATVSQTALFAISISCVGLIGQVKSRQLKSVLFVLKLKHSYSLKWIYRPYMYEPPFTLAPPKGKTKPLINKREIFRKNAKWGMPPSRDGTESSGCHRWHT